LTDFVKDAILHLEIHLLTKPSTHEVYESPRVHGKCDHQHLQTTHHFALINEPGQLPAVLIAPGDPGNKKHLPCKETKDPCVQMVRTKIDGG
jgi:hypothetical protein